MSKKHKISYLRSRIMIDNESIELLLDIIASNKLETHNEASVLAALALNISKQIGKNNKKIGILLKI